MKPERIGIISTEQGKGSGAYIALEYLLQGWCFSPGMIVVIAPQSSRIGQLARHKGFGFVDLPARKDRFLDNISAARSKLPQLKDCRRIHAWHSRGLELAWLLGRWLGVPAGGTLHDHPESTLLSRKRKIVMKFSVQRFNRLVCVSNAVRNAWENVCQPGALEVIHNGLPDAIVPKTDGGMVRIGFLGMYAGMKGFDVVASWMEKMGQKNVQWRLYGQPIARWNEQALKLAGRYPGMIVLCGEQSPETIFSEVDILVHASVEFESFGMVLVEAARAGIPVVASEIGAENEIVVHGQTGYLYNPVVNPEAGMLYLDKLVQDQNLRNVLGSAARRIYLDRFRAETMAERYAKWWGLV